MNHRDAQYLRHLANLISKALAARPVGTGPLAVDYDILKLGERGTIAPATQGREPNMTSGFVEERVRPLAEATRRGVVDREASQRIPHFGAYEDFPDSPAAYRDQTDGALERLFRAATFHAQSRIFWYDVKAWKRSRMAKNIRSLSLVLFAAGTLAPIIVTLLVKIAELFGFDQEPRTSWIWLDYFFKLPLAETGYVLLALAGALVIFDQFFDASGSWIRFRQAQARLEVLLAELRFAWAERMAECGGVLQRETTAGLVKLLRDFVTQVELLAEAETKEWAQHFSQRINAYDRNPNLRVALERDDSAAPPRRDQVGPGTAGNVKQASSPAEVRN